MTVISFTPNEGNLLLAVPSNIVARDASGTEEDFEMAVAFLTTSKASIAARAELSFNKANEFVLSILDAWVDRAEELVESGAENEDEMRKALACVNSINLKVMKAAQ